MRVDGLTEMFAETGTCCADDSGSSYSVTAYFDVHGFRHIMIQTPMNFHLHRH